MNGNNANNASKSRAVVFGQHYPPTLPLPPPTRNLRTSTPIGPARPRAPTVAEHYAIHTPPALGNPPLIEHIYNTPVPASQPYNPGYYGPQIPPRRAHGYVAEPTWLGPHRPVPAFFPGAPSINQQPVPNPHPPKPILTPKPTPTPKPPPPADQPRGRPRAASPPPRRQNGAQIRVKVRRTQKGRPMRMRAK